MEVEKLWKTILGEIELSAAPATFKTFFLPSFIESVDENLKIVKIVVPTPIAKNEISGKFYRQMQKAADKSLGFIPEFEFSVGVRTTKKTYATDAPLLSVNNGEKNSLGLYKDYQFENFIVGPSNRLAHAVALSISENPGKSYNPFFLYSSVGLGKTHLVQAIGNEIVKNYPFKKVIYATAESFMNELIESLQKGRGGKSTPYEFRKKYRNVDVLIIDDVQFIAGRESTQEEFFHTFNALYLEKKQVILTSDRPPSEINKLEARLASRFASGMIADMQVPETETRSAILRNKALSLGETVENSVLDFLAENVSSSIRELEGALTKLLVHSKSQKKEPSIEIAREVFKFTQKRQARDLGMSEITKAVAKYFGLTHKDMLGKSRLKKIAETRQICMYLIRELTNAPYTSIGTVLGGRDHSTIMHGENNVKNLILKNEKVKKDLVSIKNNLGV